MLLGAVIHIYTDHKNLTYDTLTTQRVLHWRLFIEEFHPTFHYIKGIDNVIANSISHLPQCTESIVDTDLIQLNLDPDNNAEAFSLEFDNSTLLQCLLYHPVLPDEIIFPLEYSLLHIHQLQDRSLLLQQQQLYPQKYPTITLDGIDLICHMTNIGAPWCIVIPDTLLDPILLWYHEILSHIGMTRLYNTISVQFFHSLLKCRIETMIQSCDVCQRTKLPGMGYGHLPPREALVTQWLDVAIDHIGPWQFILALEL